MSHTPERLNQLTMIKKSKHHRRMQALKSHDPMRYYELTGNPTGSDGSGSGIALGIALVVFAALIITCLIL